MEVGQKVKTLIETCRVPVGTVGTIDKDRGAKDPEKYQVKLASGGSLYYKEAELETV